MTDLKPNPPRIALGTRRAFLAALGGSDVARRVRDGARSPEIRRYPTDRVKRSGCAAFEQDAAGDRRSDRFRLGHSSPISERAIPPIF